MNVRGVVDGFVRLMTIQNRGSTLEPHFHPRPRPRERF